LGGEEITDIFEAREESFSVSFVFFCHFVIIIYFRAEEPGF